MTTDEVETISIDEFIKEHKITMEVVGGVDPKHLRAIKTVKDEDGWEHYAWRVHLFRGDQPPIEGIGPIDYRTGTGHSTRKFSNFGNEWVVTPTPPQLPDVLDSLKLDASSWDNARDFADFCADFGYDTDSRKAERMYQACGEMAKKLRYFLGREAYEQLLWKVESL